jgi:pentatricopeptide repeat protein
VSYTMAARCLSRKGCFRGALSVMGGKFIIIADLGGL